MKKLFLLSVAILMGCETGMPCQSDDECGEGAFCGSDPYNSQPICVQGCLEDADCGESEVCHQGGCVMAFEQEIQFSGPNRRAPGRARRRQPRPVEGVHYKLGQVENPSYKRVVYSPPPVYAGNSGEDEDHPYRTIPAD